MAEPRIAGAIFHFLQAEERQGRRQVKTERAVGPQRGQQGSGLATVPGRNTAFPTDSVS